MDDGAGAEDNFQDAQKTSEKVRQDVRASGFVANDEKSQWEPVQCGALLGFITNLASGLFIVPERRVLVFKDMLQQVLDGQFNASGRDIARLTSSLSLMGLALGPVVRLWTRELYRAIQQSFSWDQKMQL